MGPRFRGDDEASSLLAEGAHQLVVQRLDQVGQQRALPGLHESLGRHARDQFDIAEARDLGGALDALVTVVGDELEASGWVNGCPVATVALESTYEPVRAMIAEHFQRWLDVSVDLLTRFGVARPLAHELGLEPHFFHSNHEGEFVEELHRARDYADGLVLNPGAWTHYAWSLHDALELTGLPAVEVHLSDVMHREEWRHVSVIRDVCVATVSGQGPDGYRAALERLKAEL